MAMYPSSTRLPLLPSALLASTTRTVSGQISPTVGSAGLCGGLFILERGLPSGSLHLSKHPPAAALCSRPCTEPPTSSSSLPPSLPRSLLLRLLLLHPPRLLFNSVPQTFILPLFPSCLFPFGPFLMVFFIHTAGVSTSNSFRDKI